MNELVTHFAKSPYGWPELEIVLLIARLFVGGKIHLLVDSAKVKPKEAIDPLTKSAQWKNVKISKRKILEKLELEKARNLGKELFSSIGPDTPGFSIKRKNGILY